MADEKHGMNRGGKFLAFALPLYFIGPSVIYNAFQNQQTAWHYLVLVIGILFCAGAIYFTFRGLNLVVKAQFDSDEKRTRSGER
ncbi:DUF6095 family protein [Flavobacterium silvaticum]|uniref:Uncharacterized protein n=1 Tax=Flavobacterium silvaticum TaxID=1852020 RepID=A0A972JEF7_9FLAO|nr:DUF6095 family protein [Flavobacterium silvaticum]NMH26834.1 hypothetical protein [Flavobacterium silvaticum]